MKLYTYIDSLVSYAMNCGLAEPEDHQVLINRLLELMGEMEYIPSDEPQCEDLEEILAGLLDYAVQKGICDNNILAKDLFDAKLMGALTPMPREVIRTFREKYARSPKEATHRYYKFSGDTDYIRRYRIKKDMVWKYQSEYGEMDITINLSKPEKDPMAVAAAKYAPQSDYPKCLLCVENEGYGGRINHPNRANHRIIPIKVAGSDWYLQYSPYVYYNEHCILFNKIHTPMIVEKAAFEKLLDFVGQFPHYFIGSNADLPIVGGSILSHEHFQGGAYSFAMAQAPVEKELSFAGFEDIKAGIVKWPMSVIRLTGKEPQRLADLADKILAKWRTYTDESVGIIGVSDGEIHNTLNPIARRRGEDFELDLVLRCNITTEEHPLGVFHPHADKHHIKRENIGLIEAMGLAVLPGRLKAELHALAESLVNGVDISGDVQLQKHVAWVEELKKQYTFTKENAMDILMQETGRVFTHVLEDAGVYKCDQSGRDAFCAFVDAVNR